MAHGCLGTCAFGILGCFGGDTERIGPGQREVGTRECAVELAAIVFRSRQSSVSHAPTRGLLLIDFLLEAKNRALEPRHDLWVDNSMANQESRTGVVFLNVLLDARYP